MDAPVTPVMFRIIWLMMREEFRFHIKFASKANFFLFPAVAFLVGLVGPFGLRNMSADLSMDNMLMSLHLSLLFYGFSLGSLTFFAGDYIERRFGNVTFLRFTPRHLPWSFRKAFVAYYAQDVAFYFIITMVPLTLGGVLSAIILGIAPTVSLLLGATFFFAFWTGITLSFFSAAVFSLGRVIFALYALLLTGMLLSLLLLFKSGPVLLLPSWDFFVRRSILALIRSFLLIIALLAAGLLLIRERVSKPQVYKGRKMDTLHEYFGFTGPHSLLLSKELIDMKRSSTISKIIFSTVMPMLVITGMIWFIERGFGMELNFNTVFYAGLVGYFQVVGYSWMNNAENVDYYETLPLTVAKVIRAKIFVCVVIAIMVSTIFVVLVSILYNEVHLLPLSLLVMFFNILYCVSSIAYLTGLKTNSALFDITIFAKFSAFAMFPLTFIMVLSRFIASQPLVATILLSGLSLVMMVVVVFLHRAMDDKWSDKRFISS